MPELFKKHWTSFLGALFVICSIVYLFKYTLDQGWITPTMKTGAGLLAGAGFGLLGLKLIFGKRLLIGEILSGLGAAVLYTTFSFSGIYYDMWDPMTVFLSMLALTVGLTALAYRYGLRILMNLALLGSLAAPLVMRPEGDQVFTLFLYLLVINAAYFTLSIRKQWPEFRLLGFAGTWLTYAVYYIHFDPAADTLWSMPFRYATAAYGFYVIGFLVSSWKSGQRFDGLNLYLGFVNAVMYGLWGVTLLNGNVDMAYPLAGMGILYLLLGWIVYLCTGNASGPAFAVKVTGGALLLLLSVSRLGEGLEVKPLISVYVWGLLAALLMTAAKRLRAEWLQAVSVSVWAGVTLYWFAVTWDAPRGEWFGLYLPFFNWAAVAWMLLAALGFWYSLAAGFSAVKGTSRAFLSCMFSVIGHIIVGGLLKLQIMNLFEEYKLGGFWDEALILSVVWGVYALLLFLWGAYSKQRVFRLFGSVVLGLVSVKVLFFDLSGEDTVLKVLVLLAMSAISFAISYINHRWSEPDARADGSAVAQAGTGEPQDGQGQDGIRGTSMTVVE